MVMIIYLARIGMLFSLIIFLSCQVTVNSFHLEVAKTGGECDHLSLDPYEMQILEDIYDATDGPNWNWKPNYNMDGLPWNFTENVHNNPCQSHWQGVYCQPQYDKSTCVGNLYYIGLTGYGLKGELPASMFNMSKLMYLYMSENEIQGQIPSVTALPFLMLMNFSYNSLSGTIPFCLGTASALQLLYLSNNRLVGSIPESFTDLSDLQYLYLLNNQLTGTLPKKLGSLSKLLFLNLGVNRFHGTLPESIRELTQLEVLYLNNNSLSGPYPDYLPYSLQKLSLECNKLTGRVPQIFENYVNLTILKLNDNFFTGPPPICLSTLAHLEILQLHLNQFTGPISPLFDPAVQVKLTNIDLSHNALSGEIPPALFQLPNLKTIAAVKNCFSGTLPETICDANTVNIISLDGLTSSTACVQFMWDPLHYLNTGYFAKSMRGRIPDCVWSLPNITSLHLAGNSFTGKLFNPSTSNTTSSLVGGSSALQGQDSLSGDYISPTLKNLSLSHNRLTGTIPTELLQFPFSNLDLSYNKLQGHIDGLQYASLKNASDADSGTSGLDINLKVNRLTGEIPSALETAFGVNILEGNVFYCRSYSKLPHEDPAHNYYVCGSDELNESMIAFIIVGCFFVFFSVFGVCLYFYAYFPRSERFAKVNAFLAQLQTAVLYVRSYTQSIGVQLDSNVPVGHSLRPHVEKYTNYVRFLSSLNLMRSMFFYISLVVMVICLPIYLIFYLNDYSSHTDRYSWITTTAFLSGQTPAIALFAVWMALCAVLVSSVLFLFNKKPSLTRLNERYSSSSSSNSRGFKRSSDLPATPHCSVKEPTEGGSSASGEEVPIRASLFGQQESLSEQRTDALLSAAAGPRPSITGSVKSVESSRTRCPVRFADEPVLMPCRVSFLEPLPEEISHLRNSSVSAPAERSSESPTVDVEQPAENEDENSLLLSSHSSSSSSASSIRSATSDKDKSNTSSGDPLSSTSGSSSSFSGRASSIFERVNRKIPLLSILPMSLLFILNAFFTVTANILYVYVMLSNITSTAMFFVQITMATFKLFWNLVVVRKLISHVPYNKESIRAHSLMLIFNTLMAPCFASAVTDSACFRDLIFGSDVTTTSYSYETCLEAYQQLEEKNVYSTICTNYADIVYTTEFNPPFVYNYSCGSSILTSYIPVYIYSYTMLALMLPVAFLSLAAVPTKFIPKIFLGQIDGILRPQDRNDNLDPLYMDATGTRGSGGSNSFASSVFVRFQHIFKARSVQALSVQHLTILLTFGITSPMLAFVVACAMVIDSYVIQTLMIRYVEFQTKSSVFYNTFNTNSSGSNSSGSLRDSLNSNSSGGSAGENVPPNESTHISANTQETADGRSSLSSVGDTAQPRLSRQDSLVSRLYEEERLAELDSICGGTWRSIHHTIWLVYYCCVIFYSALLFDVVGDARGLESAISVPISGLVVGAFFRFTLSSFISFVRTRCCVSSDERDFASFRESKSGKILLDDDFSGENGGSSARERVPDKHALLERLIPPSDECYATHGLIGEPTASYQ